MKVMCFICLLLCVFLVSQNLNTAKQLSRINNRITKLEQSMESGDAVNVLKAGDLLDKAQKAITDGDKDEAALLVGRAQIELNRHKPETEASAKKAPEEELVRSVTKSIFGFLSDTVKEVGDNL